MLDYFRRPWHLGAVLALLLSAIVLLVPYRFDLGPLAEPMKEIGRAGVIAAFLAILVDGLFTDAVFRRLEEVTVSLSGAFDRLEGAISKGLGEVTGSLSGAFDLLRSSIDVGLEGILAERHSTRDDARLKEAIQQQLAKNTGEIRIMAVAASDLFVSVAGQGIWLAQLARSDSQCKLRVLFLKPDGTWAPLRAILEKVHPTLGHIQMTKDFLHQLQSRSGTRVEWKEYDFAPVVFLLLTDDYVFVESYPLVPSDTFPAGGATGGRVPMLRFRASSESYRVWKAHFDFLFNNPDPNTWAARLLQ